MNVLVLMSGGFHPFHPGHLALYNSAKQAFPGADVVVGATNVQKDRPFNFKDKATLATIAGVDKGHFVEVNRQFSVKGEPNIEGRIQNPDDTILIFVRSEKDANDPVLQPWKLNPDGSVPMTKGSKNHPPRPTSDYLLSYKDNKNKLQPMTKHAYIAFLPVQEFGPTDMTSATEIRNTWPTLNDKRKQAFAMSLYPATQQNSKLLATVVNILNRNLGPTSKPVTEPTTNPIKQLKAKKLKEHIQRMRPLLKEASAIQKYKFLKLMKESLGQVVNKEFLDGHQRSQLLMKLLDTGKYDLSDLELLSSSELIELYRQEFKKIDEISFFKIGKHKEPVDVEKEKETSPNDYHGYFNKPQTKQQTVYHGPDEYLKKTKLDPITGKKIVDELAPDPQGSGGGNYFRELASAWYNGAYKSKSLGKGIKTKQDIERLLQRGIIAPDGQTRKYNIDYNSDFDGVIIFSDDYYEYGDYDSKGRTVDSRTGKPYGPYDYMEFNDDELDESLIEFAIPGGDDNEPDEEEILFRLAKQWWLGNEQDMIKAERTLASMGWEIGEDEGYDDGGVFVVRAGDVNGKSYISWPHEDLIVDEGQTSDMRDFFKTQQPLNPPPTKPVTTGPTIATVTRQSENINEISDEKLERYLSIANRHVSNRLDRMSQARERLNKNYEIYDVNNPAKIIDRFEADTPKLAKQYFDKFIQEYNPGDIDFHFEVRRSTGLDENRIIYADTKVNLILVVHQKPILLNKEPVPYNDETLKKYALVAYMYLRDKYNKKYTLESIVKAIVVRPLEVDQPKESTDYLEEK